MKFPKLGYKDTYLRERKKFQIRLSPAPEADPNYVKWLLLQKFFGYEFWTFEFRNSLLFAYCYLCFLK